MDEFSIQGYNFVGQTRNNKHGGGVGVYVNKLHQFTERTDLSMNIENIIEAQFIELKEKPQNILRVTDSQISRIAGQVRKIENPETLPQERF